MCGVLYTRTKIVISYLHSHVSAKKAVGAPPRILTLLYPFRNRLLLQYVDFSDDPCQEVRSVVPVLLFSQLFSVGLWIVSWRSIETWLFTWYYLPHFTQRLVLHCRALRKVEVAVSVEKEPVLPHMFWSTKIFNWWGKIILFFCL